MTAYLLVIRKSQNILYAPSQLLLPKNLYEAMQFLRESNFFRRALGDDFVDYYLIIKESELNRFLSEEVTDWEHKEYFEIF